MIVWCATPAEIYQVSGTNLFYANLFYLAALGVAHFFSYSHTCKLQTIFIEKCGIQEARDALKDLF